MKVYIKSSLQHGRGVFARDQIRAGEPILTFSGPLLKHAEVREEDDLWGAIGKSLKSIVLVVLVYEQGASKVNQFRLVLEVILEENVFWLDVSVHNIPFVVYCGQRILQ